MIWLHYFQDCFTLFLFKVDFIFVYYTPGSYSSVCVSACILPFFFLLFYYYIFISTVIFCLFAFFYHFVVALLFWICCSLCLFIAISSVFFTMLKSFLCLDYMVQSLYFSSGIVYAVDNRFIRVLNERIIFIVWNFVCCCCFARNVVHSWNQRTTKETKRTQSNWFVIGTVLCVP